MQRRPRPGSVARQMAGFKAGGINAAPGEDVHANGDAILAKMMQLKSFVKNQQQGATRGAKEEWLAGHTRLRREQEGAEREIETAMRSLAEQRGVAHAAEFGDALREMETSDAATASVDSRGDVNAVARLARMVLDVAEHSA
eukprot:CAMPEP_0181368982 /NCGR_PEP_ID=MMETSP1106-20121128/12474_1 /TAXON_ID=81844 /ORGANISM="Mantoniella antarctica, Strain SL-175" /LENGTH=141 /DNA_ID=CAMNT_0023485327 /DNA_START=321 /DNA_END=744 /DNA_ORIENTATION=-